MVPTLFELLFVIAFVAPPLAVCLGLIMLFGVPHGQSGQPSVGHDMAAHA
jgi:ABC-type Fe3+ transport system permease subunit